MSKYFTEEQRRTAVDLYFQDGENSSTVIRKLGYPTTTSLLNWVHKDPRCALPNTRYKQYTQEQKLCVVAAYLDSGVTLQKAALMAGTDPSQAARWVKAYLRKGPKALEKQVKSGKPCPHKEKVRPAETSPESEIPDVGLREYCEQLKFENDVLRAELELFSKKAEASAKKG
jgi:transposase-like protein